MKPDLSSPHKEFVKIEKILKDPLNRDELSPVITRLISLDDIAVSSTGEIAINVTYHHRWEVNVHVHTIFSGLVSWINGLLHQHKIPWYINESSDDHYKLSSYESWCVLYLTPNPFVDVEDPDTQNTLNKL